MFTYIKDDLFNIYEIEYRLNRRIFAVIECIYLIHFNGNKMKIESSCNKQIED
jgi:hypothetical protein